ncbi:hypothetical protein KAI87_10065 [Myxococcota bacterium]|nr:hypothetical protein [Myxococcota bacterium]
MSSAGGGSGVGGGSNVVLPPVVSETGGVQGTAGAAAPVATTATQAAPSVDTEIAAQGLTNAQADTDILQATTASNIAGPAATTAGMDAHDVAIAQVFVDNGEPIPYHPDTTPKVKAEIEDSPVFKAASESLVAHYANPTSTTRNDFVGRMHAVQAQFPHGNVMEALFLVFKDSIKGTNEDKKYFLMKLQDYNTMAEQLSEYLQEMVGYSQQLSEAGEGQKYPDKVHIPVEVKTFDTTTLNSNGKLEYSLASREVQVVDEAATAAAQENYVDDGYGGSAETVYKTETVHNRSLDRAGLNDTIKMIESDQETIRNKRQMASTAFQNFDQKANQLYNLMSSVMKTMNEMRSGTTRNML